MSFMDTSIASFREGTLVFLREAELILSQEHSEISFSLGCLDAWPIYLSALFKEAPIDVPDQVALLIAVKPEQEGTYSIEAEVAWGDGCGSVEGSFASNPVMVDEKVLSDVYADLPRLISVLKAALMRKKPHNW